jgi:C_GCAxxG_C_C family probable redox protein
MSGKQSRNDLLDQIEKTAHDYEKEFHGCSRCVFKPLHEYLDLGDLPAFKASTPLAAGIAMRGETCGALVAGLMAIGIVTASEQFEDVNAFTNSLATGFRFARKFEKEFGTLSCTKIQTNRLGKFYNLADPEQYKAFIKVGGYIECPKVVGKTARMTAEFILDYLEKKKG